MRYLLIIICICFSISCENNKNEAVKNDVDQIIDTDQNSDADNLQNDMSNNDEDNATATDTDALSGMVFEKIFIENSGRTAKEPLYKTIANKEELLTLFPYIGEKINPDSIDFAKNLIIALSMGQKGATSCYNINMNYIDTDTKGLTLRFTEISPPSGCGCDDALSSPVLLVLITYDEIAKYFSSTYQIGYKPEQKLDCLTD